MRIAPPITLDQRQRAQLTGWARARSLPQRQVERAQIILLAAVGKRDVEIAAALKISRQKAARCRRRFLQAGLAGLEKDAPRSGRPRRIDALAIVRITTQQTPPHATPWSTRRLAQVAGISEASCSANRVFTCTTPRPVLPGSTWWNACFAISASSACDGGSFIASRN